MVSDQRKHRRGQASGHAFTKAAAILGARATTTPLSDSQATPAETGPSPGTTTEAAKTRNGKVTLAWMLSEEITSPTTPKETTLYGKDLPTRTPGSKDSAQRVRAGAQSAGIAPQARSSRSVSPINTATICPGFARP
jgi:hypothetical protein